MSSRGPTRRGFLVSGAAFASGLMVACQTALSQPGTTKGAAKSLVFAPNAWLRVTASGQIICILDRVEMGQGTLTTHALLVAEEIGVSPAAVQMEFAAVAPAYINPKFGMQLTGGSTSMAATWEPLRQAAATARGMLINAGARQLKVAPGGCRCADGRITDTASGRSVTLGAAASRSAHEQVPHAAQPLPAETFKLLGKDHGRLDEAAKIRGQAVYGIDVQLPGLLIAAVQRPAAHGATVASYDAAAALAFLREGYPEARIVEVSTGVAVVSSSAWASMHAADLIKITAAGGDLGDFTGSIGDFARREKLDQPDAAAKEVVRKGETGPAFAAAETKLEATYEVPYLAHVTMEPQNCTAAYDGETLEVWAPTQMPSGALVTAAKISGLARDRIKVHTTYIGGGFGRRIAQDYVVEAVELTMALQRPVKVLWSRANDSMHDCYRPGMLHQLAGSVNAGRVTAWSHRIIGPSVYRGVLRDFLVEMLPGMLSADFELQFLRGVFRFGLAHNMVAEPAATEGADKLPYAVPHQLVTYTYADPGVPTGFWRSVGHSHNAFAVESFINELATVAKKEPLALRRQLLATSPRDLAVLNQVAAMSGWETPLEQPPRGRRARGLAVHACFNSYCAQVVQIVTDGTTLHLEKVWCAVDCGFVVNPQIVRQQVEGGIIFGLSAAVRQRIDFKDGATVQRQMYDLGLLSLGETPRIEVALVNSRNADISPTGIGEIAVPPVAPALCAALKAATGKNFRRLPVGLELGSGGLSEV